MLNTNDPRIVFVSTNQTAFMDFAAAYVTPPEPHKEENVTVTYEQLVNLSLYDSVLGLPLEAEDGSWRFDPNVERFRNAAGHFCEDPLAEQRQEAWTAYRHMHIEVIERERRKREQAEQERAHKQAKEEAWTQFRAAKLEILPNYNATLAALARRYHDVRPASIADTEEYLERVRREIEERTAAAPKRKERALPVFKEITHRLHVIPTPTSVVGANRADLMEMGRHATDKDYAGTRAIALGYRSAEAAAVVSREEAEAYLRDELDLPNLQCFHYPAVSVVRTSSGTYARAGRLHAPYDASNKAAFGAVNTSDGKVLNNFPTPYQYAQLLAGTSPSCFITGEYCHGVLDEAAIPMLAYAPVIHGMLEARIRALSDNLRLRYILPCMLMQVENYEPAAYTVRGLHGQRFGHNGATCFYHDLAWALFVGTETLAAPIVMYVDEALDFIAAATCQVDGLVSDKGDGMNPHAPLTGGGQLYTLETWLATSMDKFQFGGKMAPASRQSQRPPPEALQADRTPAAFELIRQLEEAPRVKEFQARVFHKPYSVRCFPVARRPHTADCYIVNVDGGWTNQMLVVADAGTAQEAYFVSSTRDGADEAALWVGRKATPEMVKTLAHLLGR